MGPKDEKLYMVMVGLPSQGKSTVAFRLQDVFRRNGIPTRIFNNGVLRRKYAPHMDTWSSQFYNPENNEAVELRRKFALINIRKARRYLNSTGQVAILDATNVSRDRRELIEENLDDHPILYIQCINNDEEIVELSIRYKVKSPEFSIIREDDAIFEFNKRIEYYRMIYDDLGMERNFLRMNSLHNKIIEEKLIDQLPLYSRIRDCLVTDVVKGLFLVRHTETFFNVEDRIGGDADLTPKGLDQARALGRFFKRKKISYIFTSEKKRTIQTAELIQNLQPDCTIVPLKEFNEINSGICEGMSSW